MTRIKEAPAKKSLPTAPSAEQRTLFERRLEGCTPKEMQVLELMVNGYTSDQIAEFFGKSMKTVEVQRYSILRRMACKSSVELTKEFWCWKLAKLLPEPAVVIRFLRGKRYFYMGYFGLPNANHDVRFPAETRDEKLAVVFDNAAIAHRIVKAISENEASNEWKVALQNQVV